MTGATIRPTVRGFVSRGWTPAEAGNVTAWLVGLPPIAEGWTPATIEQLLFMAWAVRSGLLAGDTLPDPDPWVILWG